MILSRDLYKFIKSVSNTLAGPIMAELRTDGAKRQATVLLMLLDRIASDVSDGDAIAARNLAAWERLEADCELFGLGRAMEIGEVLPSRERFGARIGAVQQALADPERFEAFMSRLRDGDAQAEQWLRDACDVLLGINSEIEESYAAQGERSIANAVDRAPALRAGLAAYLQARFPELPDDPILEFAIVAGGFSKLTALFTLAPNPVLPERLVLRMDIENAITPCVLEDEYPVLKRVYALGLPVPRPVLFEPDRQHLGGAFIFMEQVVDAVVAGSPFVEDRRRTGANIGPGFGVEVARLIGKLHGATLEAQPDPQIAQAREREIATMAGEWRSMEKSPFSLQLDLALAWLLAHPLPDDRPVCLIHGDFAPHNVLTRGGKVASLLDWELAKRGDPAEDMAEIKLMLIGGIIEWEDFVREYLAAGGPPSAVDPHAIGYYAIIVYLQHGVNQTRLRNNYLNGERTDLEAMICASHFQDRINLYQAKALREALGARTAPA